MLALSVGRATAMARAAAGLPAGLRLSDHISLGVIAKTFPLDQVRHILTASAPQSQRRPSNRQRITSRVLEPMSSARAMAS